MRRQKYSGLQIRTPCGNTESIQVGQAKQDVLDRHKRECGICNPPQPPPPPPTPLKPEHHQSAVYVSSGDIVWDTPNPKTLF